MKLVSLLLCISCVSLPCYAVVYKWTDEDGKIHYSDKPKDLKTDESEEYKLKLVHKPDPYLEQRMQKIKEAQESKKNEGAENKQAAAEKKAKAAEHKKHCKFWTEKQQLLNQQAPIFNIDENGNRHYYDDAERAQKQQEAASKISKYCH